MKIDIWSDIACPFCYLGKTTLETALAKFGHRDEVEIEYHSFLLNPDLPVDYDGDINDMLEREKGISRGQAALMNARVAQLAADQGMEWRTDDMVVTNLAAAHRLIHFAKAQGSQAAMVDRLYRAYFSEGQHLGKIPVLAALAGEVGLDPDEAAQVLRSDRYAADVEKDIQHARRLGASGVPLFVINDKYGIAGAQNEDVFRDSLEQAWQEEHPLVMTGQTVDAASGCNDGVCTVHS